MRLRVLFHLFFSPYNGSLRLVFCKRGKKELLPLGRKAPLFRVNNQSL